MNGLNAVFIFKWLILTAVVLGLSYFYSYALEKLLQTSFSFAERFAAGFVAIMAAAEFTGWPMVAFRLPTAVFAAAVIPAVFLPAAYGVYLCMQKRHGSTEKKLFTDNNRRLNFAVMLAAAAVLTQIVMTAAVYRADADDSFYVSNVELFAHSAVLNQFDSSMGSTALGTVPMYDFQVWESLLALLCRCFSLSAASLCHTCMLPVLLLVSASAFFLLGNSLFHVERKAWLFSAAISVFHLFSGANDYNAGTFLLSRIWQGKAASLTIVLPVLSGLLLRCLYRQNEHDTRLWLSMLLCLLAAMGFNPTGLYTVGFELLFLGISVAVAAKRAKYLLHLLPSLLGALFFAGMIYWRTSGFPDQVYASSQPDASFVAEQFRLFISGQEIWLYMFLLLFVLVALFGNRIARTYFTLCTLLLALVVWSPFTGRLIAQYLTKTPSYWRVFWLIPIGPLFAYCAVWVSDKLPKKTRLTALLLCGVLIAAPGRWMFDAPDTLPAFIAADNVEKVPQETLEFDEILKEQKVVTPVLACHDLSTTLRQIDSQLVLLVSRPQYILDLYTYRGNKQTGQDLMTLWDFANGYEPDKVQTAYTLLLTYQVHWVILKNNSESAQSILLQHGWKLVVQSDIYSMLTDVQ